MRIADFPDCHKPLVQVLPIELAPTGYLDYFAAFGPMIALLGVGATIVMYQSGHNRALRTERDQLLKLMVAQLEGEEGTARGAAEIDLTAGTKAEQINKFLVLLGTYRVAGPSGYLEASTFKLGLLNIETISELMLVRSSKSALDSRIDRILENFKQDPGTAYMNILVKDQDFAVLAAFQKNLLDLADKHKEFIAKIHNLIEDNESQSVMERLRFWSKT